MGSNQSGSRSHVYEEAARCYTTEELGNWEADFHHNAHSSPDTGMPCLDLRQFEGWAGKGGLLAARVFVGVGEGSSFLSLDQILQAKMAAERSPKASAINLAFRCARGSSRALTWEELKEVMLEGILEIHGAASSTSAQEVALAEAASSAAASITGERPDLIRNSDITQDAFHNWAAQVPALVNLLLSYLRPSGRTAPLVPTLHSNCDSSTNLLVHAAHAWIIGSMLQDHQRAQWSLLYNSKLHGTSLSTFVGKCTGRGAAILVVKDTKGHIFGAFAAEPWRIHADFFGNFHTFLYQLIPTTRVHRPSGKNDKFQWCAANFQSVRNGIGFGHQENRYGLWIDKDMTSGSSYQCSTFDSPCLAHTTEFEIDTIECWEVSPSVKESNNSSSVTGSVLDRFKEDRAVLQMAGHAGHSEGVR